MLTIDAKVSGPFFDGRIETQISSALDETEEEVGRYGVSRIHIELGTVLKNPTGFYQSRIQTERQFDTSVINDAGVIYGPWLEGVSSRNSITRFKGYATFRRMWVVIDKEAQRIAETVFQRRLK